MSDENYVVQHRGPVFWLNSSRSDLTKEEAEDLAARLRKGYSNVEFRTRLSSLPMDDQLNMWVGKKKVV